MIKTLLYIGFGSFAGGVLRFLLSKAVGNNGFPFGTMAVNILGCLLIGLLYGFFQKNSNISTELQLMLTVGFCGGFTTFSTFSNESLSLLQSGNYLYFILYISASIVLGILAVFTGYAIVR